MDGVEQQLVRVEGLSPELGLAETVDRHHRVRCRGKLRGARSS